MTDLAVHDGPIFAFTMTDLAVHDGPIFAFTMVRNSHVLGRRSQNGRIDARQVKSLEIRWLPRPEICHPYPLVRFGFITQGKSRMR
jgi:hypothetical protein